MNRQKRYRNMLWALLLLPGMALAAEWQLGKDESGVRVYSRDAAGGGIEVKAETTVDAPLVSVMALILDYNAATRWRASMIKSMKVKEQPNDHTWILQVHAEPPWPLPANESVIEAQLQAKPDRVVYHYKERPDLQPQGTKSALGAMNGEWILKPAGEGRTQVTNVMMMKPNIPVPDWLIKRMIYSTPHEQMVKLGKVAGEPQYRPSAAPPKIKELLAPTLSAAARSEGNRTPGS
ncbi:MAG: START domain-containing protein [Pseudomonadota bacterium]|nr:START domain-containing protein [Candidatus Acidoferrales bacterium]